jgi:F-type H+-transporting ATPase subunit b
MSFDATFWVAVSFFIFVGGLIYLKIPNKVNEALGSKIIETKNELEEAEKLKDDAKILLSNYENKLSEAVKETSNIINRAKKNSEESLILSTEKFHKSMDYQKKSVESKIEQMKEDAVNEIKKTSIKISIEAAEKIIKNSIDKKKLDRFYDENLIKTKEVLKKTIT